MVDKSTSKKSPGGPKKPPCEPRDGLNKRSARDKLSREQRANKRSPPVATTQTDSSPKAPLSPTAPPPQKVARTRSQVGTRLRERILVDASAAPTTTRKSAKTCTPDGAAEAHLSTRALSDDHKSTIPDAASNTIPPQVPSVQTPHTEGRTPNERIGSTRHAKLRTTWAGADFLHGSAVGLGVINDSIYCFIICILQLITYCPPLARFLGETHKLDCALKYVNCVACDFVDLHLFRVFKENKPLCLDWIHTHLRRFFPLHKEGVQQDSHEFLHYLLSEFDRSWGADSIKANDSWMPMDTIMGFFFRTTRTCEKCQSSVIRDDKSRELNIPIDNQTSTLKSLISKLFTEEDVEYKCEKCGHDRSVRKSRLHEPPPVLVIQIMRFAHGERKITTSLDYEEEMDLHEFTSDATAGGCGTATYSLNGIVEHRGQSVSNGHCIAYGRSTDDTSFYKFDDASVTKVIALPAQPYLLVFIRKDPTCASAAASAPLSSSVMASESSSELRAINVADFAEPTPDKVPCAAYFHSSLMSPKPIDEGQITVLEAMGEQSLDSQDDLSSDKAQEIVAKKEKKIMWAKRMNEQRQKAEKENNEMRVQNLKLLHKLNKKERPLCPQKLITNEANEVLEKIGRSDINIVLEQARLQDKLKLLDVTRKKIGETMKTEQDEHRKLNELNGQITRMGQEFTAAESEYNSKEAKRVELVKMVIEVDKRIAFNADLHKQKEEFISNQSKNIEILEITEMEHAKRLQELSEKIKLHKPKEDHLQKVLSQLEFLKRISMEIPKSLCNESTVAESGIIYGTTVFTVLSNKEDAHKMEERLSGENFPHTRVHELNGSYRVDVTCLNLLIAQRLVNSGIVLIDGQNAIKFQRHKLADSNAQIDEENGRVLTVKGCPAGMQKAHFKKIGGLLGAVLSDLDERNGEAILVFDESKFDLLKTASVLLHNIVIGGSPLCCSQSYFPGAYVFLYRTDSATQLETKLLTTNFSLRPRSPAFPPRPPHLQSWYILSIGPTVAFMEIDPRSSPLPALRPRLARAASPTSTCCCDTVIAYTALMIAETFFMPHCDLFAVAAQLHTIAVGHHVQCCCEVD